METTHDTQREQGIAGVFQVCAEVFLSRFYSKFQTNLQILSARLESSHFNSGTHTIVRLSFIVPKS